MENALKVAGLWTERDQPNSQHKKEVFQKREKPSYSKPPEPKNPIWSYPQEYFLNFLGLARAQNYGSPAPDGTPTWWERRANAEYSCSACNRTITKGDRYIGEKKLHPGQRGAYGYRGTYSTHYYHIVCLLRNAAAKTEGNVRSLDSQTNILQKEIVDYKKEVAYINTQIESCQMVIIQQRTEYTQVQGALKKVGKWFSTNYTCWSKNREIATLTSRKIQVENIEIPKRQNQISELTRRKKDFQQRLGEVNSKIVELS